MHKKIIALLVAILSISACSTSSAIFRSGIRFEGEQAREDRHGLYQIDLNKSLGVSLIGNCAEIVHKGTMTFPFIPMPPVLPTGNKVKKDAAKRPFEVIIQSAHGLKVNYQQLRLSLTVAGKTQVLPFTQQKQDKRGSRQYFYATDYTCDQVVQADISVAKLAIAGTMAKIGKHSMSFFEETKWSYN